MNNRRSIYKALIIILLTVQIFTFTACKNIYIN